MTSENYTYTMEGKNRYIVHSKEPEYTFTITKYQITDTYELTVTEAMMDDLMYKLNNGLIKINNERLEDIKPKCFGLTINDLTKKL